MKQKRKLLTGCPKCGGRHIKKSNMLCCENCNYSYDVSMQRRLWDERGNTAAFKDDRPRSLTGQVLAVPLSDGDIS